MSAERTIAVADIRVRRNRMRRLRPDVVDGLAESIAERGLLQAIVVQPVNEATFSLVVGHHRLEAVKKLGHDTIRAAVRHGLDKDEALLAEIDENLVRADLSAAERALHLHERKRLYEKLHPETRHGVAGGKARHGSAGAKMSFAESTAKAGGKSTRTIQREVERAAKIENLADLPGTSLDTADELDALTKLPPSVQAALITRAKAGESVTAKHVAQRLRREAREQELAAATEAASAALGKKLYGVIYADPPWRFEVYDADSGLNQAAEAHYPCMGTADIAALPVPAADSCVLFLWSTAPHLPEALDVMRAWGFAYRTNVVWKKDRTGLGYWFRNQHEHLLVGVRGDVPAPSPEARFASVVEAPRTAHSVKPDAVAAMIEHMFPNMPKLEMFARKARPGWDVWGNEAPGELGEYDGNDDFAKSYELALDTIRARKAAGGPGWPHESESAVTTEDLSIPSFLKRSSP
jgi:N6-adenosine-specific RNA methylase IME4